MCPAPRQGKSITVLRCASRHRNNIFLLRELSRTHAAVLNSTLPHEFLKVHAAVLQKEQNLERVISNHLAVSS